MAGAYRWNPHNPNSELKTLVLLRQALREHDYLPEITEGEGVSAFADALMQGWFFNRDGRRDDARLMRAAIEAWTLSQAPCAFMPAISWIELFEGLRDELGQIGLGYSGTSEYVTVYRGSLREHFLNPSFTTSFGAAAWFSLRQSARGGVGEIYGVTIPRSAVLVDLRSYNPAESEVVVDSRRITEVHHYRLTVDERKRLAREWIEVQNQLAALAQLVGYHVLEFGTMEAPPAPAEGWPPFPQCVDETAPGYFEPPFTPDTIEWPRPEDVEYIGLGDGDFTVKGMFFLHVDSSHGVPDAC